MRIPFAEKAYSNSYGLPPARLVNMFAEREKSAPVQDARLPRPGLASAFTLGTGPNRGLFSKKGVFGGALFIVSGTTLYTSDGTVIGTIPGTDMVRFDASASQLVMVSSGLAYLWDGTTLGQITDPDLPTVVDLAFMAGRFAYEQQGSGRFYWSEIDDAGNIAGLNFSNAESSPDFNTGVMVLGDQLALFGGETVEFWSATSDGDNPFQKDTGTRYQKGTPARDAIVAMDNALFFVGNDRLVYRTDSVPSRVSDHGIEEKLRRCTNVAACTAFTAVIEGHAWYVLNIPGIGSFAYDVSTSLWAEWKSFNHTTFRGCASATVDGIVYIGDDTTSTVWKLSVGTYLDGADPISFLASAYVPNPAGDPIRCDRIRLDCVRGVGTSTGQGFSPLVEMRYSDDQGRTWREWRQATLGKIGEYSKRAYWNRLGSIKPPGRLFEFRSTDPVNTVFAGVAMNERA